MGTQHISLTGAQPRRRRSSFRRLFVWYCLGILAATFLVTCCIEVLLLIWILLVNAGRVPWVHNGVYQFSVILLFISVPFIVLAAAILFFAWLMGRKISRPVAELLSAVEKIRQQDLNFTITYSARNELGDLCSAFNDLRRELQWSLEREWRKQEEMRTMIAALSHDLRTPVTIIQGHIEGLARAEAGEKRNQRLERYLPVLEASSQRMTRLLNDMLLVSTLEQTSFIMQPQPVALAEAFERKAHVYCLQATAQEIAFSSACHQLSPDTAPVLLDWHRIEQVLDNLFENALRYTPAQGRISLTCTRDTRALNFVLRDTGCGIAPEDLPHLCEKFYHGSMQPGARPHKASGLGLYVCKLLVERHGGVITIQNHPAGGCEVTVCLPLLQG
jgi:signal transduction histidine kinase